MKIETLFPPMTVITPPKNSEVKSYVNHPLTCVNDHVIRMSIMTEPFYWHLHPNSDETFLVLEGSMYIDMDDRTVELQTGQLFTVPKNVPHRTRPKGDRSVNLTFELQQMETIPLERQGTNM